MVPQNKSHNNKHSEQRQRMAMEQLIPRGIENQSILEAMKSVPRHRFVPETNRDRAYQDSALPIKQGQTISQPYIVALMIAALEPVPEDKVLDIGTGSGYAAAVISRIVSKVYTVEFLSDLAEQAEALFTDLTYDNIEIIVGDGSRGYPEQAPYDGIIVSACAPEVPDVLVEQLKPGGRLVIPVGDQRGLQKLYSVKKIDEETVDVDDLGMVRFVPLLGEHGFSQIGKY